MNQSLSWATPKPRKTIQSPQRRLWWMMRTRILKKWTTTWLTRTTIRMQISNHTGLCLQIITTTRLQTNIWCHLKVVSKMAHPSSMITTNSTTRISITIQTTNTMGNTTTTSSISSQNTNSSITLKVNTSKIITSSSSHQLPDTTNSLTSHQLSL